ncbi:Flp family type IVb pilin [Afifella marina]|uniref:Flp pilus assembly protein, pilin Flp n=1 Tax=Afifella marina DSM 2698 TaxID=1120955 RepID=A0A1G5NKP2_AFIMA|nr:hypothetical protein [Afifella marina]MBK1623636.1 hypothetical protein [Afifella marina DSM 2698]MBK1626629.1 hypothetical protein [Afifella marina]MBK5916178.1 hypothetical protein [Afifella marina]RAI21624.1 hypothetical protein CH311_06300 [Afifella marina DSM 2698]SCZ37468.1 Flp pilus assembly protein, pilin Flp [Afifella marina DSM 2698]
MGGSARRFWRDDAGNSTSEYALIAALIAVVSVAGVKLTSYSLDKLATELAMQRMDAGALVAASEDREDTIITGSIRQSR